MYKFVYIIWKDKKLESTELATHEHNAIHITFTITIIQQNKWKMKRKIILSKIKKIITDKIPVKDLLEIPSILE